MSLIRPNAGNRTRSFAALAIAAYSMVSLAPSSNATPQAQVPCGVLDQIRGSLDNDIAAGTDGVRTVISSPYLVGAVQKRDADARLAMVSHGVTVMQGINANNVVPGLAEQLDQLSRANDDMRQAVDGLFIWSGGGGFGYGSYGGSVSNAWPQPSTWTIIDYVDQQKNDIYGLVNGLQGSCIA